jgi:hypothetical protein
MAHRLHSWLAVCLVVVSVSSLPAGDEAHVRAASFGLNAARDIALQMSDQITGDTATAGSSGCADSVAVYLSQWYTSSVPVKCALYRVSDDAFMGGTEERDEVWSASTPRREAFAFESEVCIESGVQYYIVVWSDSTVKIWGELQVGTAAKKDPETYGSWPNPIATTDISHVDLYVMCYYTEGPCPASDGAFVRRRQVILEANQ